MPIVILVASLPVAVIAWLCRSRLVYLAALLGGLVSWLLWRPLESARYDDPFDELVTHAQLDLEGLLPGMVIGFTAGVVMTRLRRMARQPPSNSDGLAANQ